MSWSAAATAAQGSAWPQANGVVCTASRGGAWLDLADFNRGQARQYHRRRLTAAIEAGVAALDDARLLAH
jgi:hypothetical protein